MNDHYNLQIFVNTLGFLLFIIYKKVHYNCVNMSSYVKQIIILFCNSELSTLNNVFIAVWHGNGIPASDWSGLNHLTDSEEGCLRCRELQETLR